MHHYTLYVQVCACEETATLQSVANRTNLLQHSRPPSLTHRAGGWRMVTGTQQQQQHGITVVHGSPQHLKKPTEERFYFFLPTSDLDPTLTHHHRLQRLMSMRRVCAANRSTPISTNDLVPMAAVAAGAAAAA